VAQGEGLELKHQYCKKKKKEKWKMMLLAFLSYPWCHQLCPFFTWSLSPLLFPSFQSPGLQTSSNLGLWYQRMVLLRQITVPFVIYIYILWNIFIEFYENRRMRWVMPVILATQEERSGGLWFKATSQSFIYIYIFFFFWGTGDYTQGLVCARQVIRTELCPQPLLF
jgi:hypothetical protein